VDEQVQQLDHNVARRCCENLHQNWYPVAAETRKAGPSPHDTLALSKTSPRARGLALIAAHSALASFDPPAGGWLAGIERGRFVPGSENGLTWSHSPCPEAGPSQRESRSGMGKEWLQANSAAGSLRPLLNESTRISQNPVLSRVKGLLNEGFSVFTRILNRFVKSRSLAMGTRFCRNLVSSSK
jgi:hypothetical protein